MNRLRAWIASTPSARAECLGWALILAAGLAARLTLLAIAPTYFWSGDAARYVIPALEWAESGHWSHDAKRGPVYTLLAGLAVWITGDLTGLIWIQHAIGLLSVLASVAVLRLWFGRRALVPWTACGIAFALYNHTVYLEHLIRIESWLTALASFTLAALALGLFKSHELSARLALAFSGFSAATLGLLKSVFAPLPLLVVAWFACLAFARRSALPLLAALAFIAGWAVPTLSLRIYESLNPDLAIEAPQTGKLLFGRVAQWTVLNSGIEPELKALIRQDILDYQALGKLDNNIILKRTAVPRLREALVQRGHDEVALDTLCRRLAFEAIAYHPGPFAAQVWSDWTRLHLEFGYGDQFPQKGDMRKLREDLGKFSSAPPTLNQEATRLMYSHLDRPDAFAPFHRLTATAWLFELLPPVLLTSLLIPFLLVARPAERNFWLIAGTLWFLNLAVIVTVGKPLHRYLAPVVPIMFLALSAPLCWGWLRLGASHKRT